LQTREELEPGENPDNILMQRLQGGEDSALNRIMERWQKPLVEFTFRYVGNRTDAIELAQEVFVRVYESRDRYRQSAKFSSWLFTIAANLCRNWHRWKSRHPTITLDGDEDEDLHSHNLHERLESPQETPAQIALKIERIEMVRACIEGLPHDLKTAVLLFEYENLSHQEIGQILNCTPKAIETRLYRARSILREQLQKLLGEE